LVRSVTDRAHVVSEATDVGTEHPALKLLRSLVAHGLLEDDIAGRAARVQTLTIVVGYSAVLQGDDLP